MIYLNHKDCGGLKICPLLFYGLANTIRVIMTDIANNYMHLIRFDTIVIDPNMFHYG